MNRDPHFPCDPQTQARDVARDAVALLASAMAGERLRVASHNIVGELAARHGFRRVSLGILRDDFSVVEAVSNLDAEGPGTDLLKLLAAAMDEAIEQSVSVAVPGSPASVVPITLAHNALRERVGGSVATVPMAVNGRPFAAVLVERGSPQPIDANELQTLEDMLALAAPALALMQRDERSWHQRLRADVWTALARLRGPTAAACRWRWSAVSAAFLVAAAWPLAHHVGGRARIEGAEQRVLVAPTDGFLKATHVRPGDAVRQGAPLVDLIEQDLRLERSRWASQLAQHENAYASAMAKADRTQAAISVARASEAQAQLALVDAQLGRAQLTAPFDGVVIQGDLSQAIGAPVRQGDPLLTIAATHSYRVIVEIDETDIARVRPGQRGEVSLSALPWDSLPVLVQRITPLAKAVDGANLFEVQAELLHIDARVRPGLQGRAKLVVGQRPLLWGWVRYGADRLRMFVWTWLG